ncbi:hypothetical protein CK203_107916 [Vitis vinifera]|uniref:Retrotransposon gag domain-containing protein n=1 Tax=Vitis vinifera TaxID=29760 RepID=A0A438DCU5_VITVI|nr:hypothetical protein CK203_107916 [Vitis vinifera]
MTVVTKDPLPTHDTRAIPPPPRGIHLIEHIEGDVFMMGWDGEAPQRSVHVPPLSPFIMFLEGYGLAHRDVQIVTQSGRVAHPPPVNRGSDHVQPLFIDVTCLGRKVSSVLLDNGSTLNVCSLVTAIALGFSPSDFRSSTQTIRAYDRTQRTVMGTLIAHVMIRPVRYSVLSRLFNLEDDSRDMVPMSFDQYSSTLVLNMMRGMSYISTWDWVAANMDHEFIFTVDHDIPYGLGYTPMERMHVTWHDCARTE